MNRAITQSSANRAILKQNNQIDTVSQTLGFIPVPSWIEPAAQATLNVLTAYEIPAQSTMVRESLHGTKLYASGDVSQHLNWVLMPHRYDALLYGEGLQMPRHIQKTYHRALEAVKAGALDDVYIAHAWGNADTPLIASGYVQPNDIPWKEIEALSAGRMERFWDGVDSIEARLSTKAARIILAIGRAVGLTLVVSGKTALALVIGAFGLIAAISALVISAIVALAAVAAAALTVVASAIAVVVGLAVVIVAAPTTGIDPIIYGVKRIEDGYGRSYDVLHKLAEYDIK